MPSPLETPTCRQHNMSTSAPLQGQVAIVTGGASGIGRAVGELFAEAGLSGLAVIDVAECDLPELDAEVVTGQFDVADADAVSGFISEVHDRFGRIDILVNNAGILRDRMIFCCSNRCFNILRCRGTVSYTLGCFGVSVDQPVPKRNKRTVDY